MRIENLDTCAVRLVSTTKTEPSLIKEIVAELSDRINNGDISEEELIKYLNSDEGLMAYIARVSSPNQENTKHSGLLKYCINQSHWSVFQMCDMTLEIITSRGIAPQILRHSSFSFQEFSQRYAEVPSEGIIIYIPRRQDIKNRQNSINDLSEEDKLWFQQQQQEIWDKSFKTYKEAINRGIAKESARFILPLNTITRMYMKGSVRSWIHYINLRSSNGTQLEHQVIASKAKTIFVKQFPTISEALLWK